MATPDDLMHCPICLELYEQPRALPCLHTFCSRCLQEYINAAARATSVLTGFECPVCRRHTVPTGQANHSEWSNLFPLNHIIVSLIDSRNNQSTENQRKGFGVPERIAGSHGTQPVVTSSSSEAAITNRDPPLTSAETKRGLPDDYEFDFVKDYENTSEHDEEEDDWPPPQEGPPPHWGHWGPPPHGPHFHHCHPPHRPPPHHGPPGHWPPPPRGPPGHGPPSHWPPPPHHRPHHRGRGCHRPGGRFHHPHGPRHRHPGPWRGGPP